MKKSRHAPCPVCAGHKLQACPECNGTGNAICHRCLSPVKVGDWVAREDLGLKPAVPIYVFFCKTCSDEIGITIGPRIRRVA